MANEVGQEILRQLGGGRFVAMTGAKSFAAGKFPEGEGLSFRLPRIPGSKIKGCIITLNAKDLYDLRFIGQKNAPSYEVFTVAEHSDIYAENLVEMFEGETGLYCSL